MDHIADLLNLREEFKFAVGGADPAAATEG
jgi:hypothetical protein